jgi:hypothetical protein
MSVRKAVLCLSLALPLALAGCSGDDGEAEIINCASDTECLEGSEICHPVGKVCVATCTIADDCPDTQKNCEEVKVGDVAMTTEKVCQCSTNELCKGDDEAAEVVCSPVDNICEDKCATDDDCAVFTSTSRECVEGACVPKATCSATSCIDPSASKCGEDGKCGACAVDADCTHLDGFDKCDNGVCVAPSCNANNKEPGLNFGPDICAYGQICDATNGCVDVAGGTCAAASSYSWNESQQGPVIFATTSQGFASSDTAKECGDGGAKLEVTVSFYAPKGLTYNKIADLLHNWTTDKAQQIVFVRSSGSTHGAAFVRDTPDSGATSGTFVVGACGIQAAEGRAIYIKDAAGNGGNAFCIQ